MSTEQLVFQGSRGFRSRLVLATLSGRSIKITHIHAMDQNVGMKDYHISFVRLIDKLTNGSHIEISATGTALLYRPGVITGGKISHDCGTSRAIGYYLEPILMLSAFSKKPISLSFTGITNDNKDISVDTLRTVLMPQLHQFGITEYEMKIAARGAPPEGGGQVIFWCLPVRILKPIMSTEEGLIRRIRGIAYCTRVSPQTANRLIDSSRALLNRFIPDVYIFSDHYKGAESGKSPGFGLTLVAESTKGALISAECMAGAGDVPEDIGRKVAKMLYHEISKGGCYDERSQCLVLLLMTLCSEDVSKVRFGKLTETTIEFLRDLKKVFGITFRIEPDTNNKTVLLTCLGVGHTNVNKAMQ